MVHKLKGFAMEDFERVLVERGVVERLNRLEDVVAEGRRRKARAGEGEGAPVA
jgi:kinetochore protein NNF1